VQRDAERLEADRAAWAAGEPARRAAAADAAEAAEEAKRVKARARASQTCN
jgi:hypothetical protein